ncbi:MAG: helix-turn-helix domain-containing protein [Mycobacterium sp.]
MHTWVYPPDAGREPTDIVAGIAKRLLDDHLGVLADRAVMESRAAERAYRILVAEADHRLGAEATIAFVLWSMSGESMPEHLQHTPESTGQLRCAGGVPLESVLHCFRIDFRVVWDAMLELVVGEVPADQHARFLAGASRVWEAIDIVSSRVTNSYHLAEQSLDRQRSVLVDALLGGSEEVHSVARRLVAEYGFGLDSRFVVAFAELDAQAQPGLREPRSVLSTAGLRSAWRLDQGGQVGIIELQSGGPDVPLAELRRIAGTRVGVTPVIDGLESCRGRLWLAQTAARTLPVGAAGVESMTDRLLAAFAACAPELSRFVVGEVFGDAAQTRTPEWGRLMETVAAYADCDGSVEETAKRLYIHRNTAHQRLRAIQKITGRNLRSPRQAAELLLAVEAYRLHQGNDAAHDPNP